MGTREQREHSMLNTIQQKFSRKPKTEPATPEKKYPTCDSCGDTEVGKNFFNVVRCMHCDPPPTPAVAKEVFFYDDQGNRWYVHNEPYEHYSRFRESQGGLQWPEIILNTPETFPTGRKGN